jgi:alcohol dehydrogenase
MLDFEFVSPTHFVFGKGVENKVGEKLKAAGAKKVLVHFGGGSARKSGLINRVEKSLEQAGLEFVELGGVRPNPEITLVREGQKICKENGIDWILPIGGGSVIDSAKGIAISANYDGDPWDFYAHKTAVTEALPIAVVLTIPAAGSEGSKNSVVSNDELQMKSGCGNDLERPKFAFMNPELTMSLPKWQTAAGCTDMFAHLLERFFDNQGTVTVTDNLNISLMKTVRTEALRVMNSPDDYDARANIMWAGMLCHQGLAGVGREEDWATHGLEHELSALKTEVTHGAGLAVMFPAWMTYVFKENVDRFCKYGYEVFGISPSGCKEADAKAAILATRQFFSSLGMPKNLGDLGFVEDDIEKMIPTLEKNKGKEFGSFKKLNMDDAREIYRLAL